MSHILSTRESYPQYPFFNVEKVKSLILKDMFSDDLHKENNEDPTCQPLQPDSLLHGCFIYEAQNAIEEGQNELDHPTNEYLPLTDEEAYENLIFEKYHQKVCEELQNNFFLPKLNNNNLKIFRQRRGALKCPRKRKMLNTMAGAWSRESQDQNLVLNCS